MASNKTKKVSTAARRMQYALGEHRVELRRLYPGEFDQWLQKFLRDVDLRELGGFKDVASLLYRRADDYCLSVAKDVKLETKMTGGTHEYEFTLKSELVGAAHRIIGQELTYRRHESRDETTDRGVALKWGKQGYIYAGEERVITLWRAPEYRSFDEIIVELRYHYTKVPHENEYLIDRIKAILVPRAAFRRHFGKAYPAVAMDLVWEIRTAYSRTLQDLESQTSNIRRKSEEYGRISNMVF